MTRRRGPSEQVLIAGTEQDLPQLSMLVASLPADAFGQVLLESPAGLDLASGLDVPGRVTVHDVRRPAGCALGDPLAEALRVWAQEWLLEGDRGLREQHELWIGGASSRAVHLVREVLFAEACAHVHSVTPLGDLATRDPA